MTRPASLASLLMEAIRARVDSTSALQPVDGQLLRGLEGIAVVDVHVGPALQARGIAASRLRDRLREQLALAQIPTPRPSDGAVLGGLQVIVKGIEAGDGTWALCVALEVRQRARLSRDVTSSFDATTWVAELVATCSEDDLQGTCLHLVAGLTEQLAAALRGAHMKVGP
jgi:hypothetical protein